MNQSSQKKQSVEKRSSYRKRKISTFATGNEENPNACIYCDESHKLEGCERFMENTLKERIKFQVNKLVNFVKTILNLKTMHDKRTGSTTFVEGKQMTGISGDDRLLILPKLYARTKTKMQFQQESRNLCT